MAEVTRKELAEIIGKKTLHLKDKKQLVKSLAAYLAADEKPVDLNSLIRDVMQYRLEQGIVEVVAVSAHTLDSEVIQDIRVLLKEHFPNAKSIIIDQRTDETLVGGIRIELPNEVLDLSVRSKLNMFKRLVAEEMN